MRCAPGVGARTHRVRDSNVDVLCLWWPQLRADCKNAWHLTSLCWYGFCQMRSAMDLEGELREILRKKLPKDTNIDANAKLSEVGLDSLDVAEIAFDVEDKFRIQLPPLAAQSGEVTFADLFRLVE